jgi:Bifunctional DNA primase/polymerase, N-terminal
LRDAALGYASRGLPVLPCTTPSPTTATSRPSPAASSYRIRRRGLGARVRIQAAASQAPLGALVPHGVKDATTNRARILAWWTRHPHANIGLATGHAFDVLDIDGPTGEDAVRTLAAEHRLHSSGPLVRTGGGGWHFCEGEQGRCAKRRLGLV